jgi:hypothetical protein
MKIWTTGIDYSTGMPLTEPATLDQFGERLQQGLQRNVSALRQWQARTTGHVTFRNEIERARSTDLNDPAAAGWTFLIHKDDPSRSALIERLKPLALHRGMRDPSRPLRFGGEEPDEWFDWMHHNYTSIRPGDLPHYILLVGGPDQIPFRFQSLLAGCAAVGRVAFDRLDDLSVYVDKVIELERRSAPVVRRDCVLFAPDGGVLDATHFSHRYMAKPLSGQVRDLGFGIEQLLADDATKKRLLDRLIGSSPALVYTASHGMAASTSPLDVQKRVNGGICCQHAPGDNIATWLFTADDVPADRPFLEGSVFFQFACYGYGTPAESDYGHWVGGDTFNSSEDFLSALPKRLLMHPRGPIAYIGHVDAAWLHGFADPDDPYILDEWQQRMAPFRYSINSLFTAVPVGRALLEMNRRYNVCNSLLTNTFDRLERGKLRIEDVRQSLIQAFITRSDAQNYMLLGDPGAFLRIFDAMPSA